jgi:sortase A
VASKRYKKIFAIRYLAYLGVMVGTLGILFQFGPILAVELTYRKDQLFGIRHFLDNKVITSANGEKVASASAKYFGDLVNKSPLTIIPISTDFGIVIEKINANSEVISQVDPGDEKAYEEALKKGVAEAKGSTEPGDAGNLYIFSHSTDAPWNIARYNAVFYLLRELNQGDRIVVFYKHRRYDYEVFDKQIVKPDDLSFLQNRYDRPVLTLQTCDPPGTSINRLIVRAVLRKK